MKACTRCGQIRPLDEFEKDKRHKDGRGSRCRVCIRKHVSDWAKANRERRNARPYNATRKRAAHERRMANPEIRQKINDKSSERCRANPDKVRARQIAQRAVRSGVLTRPANCEDRGREMKWIDGHHDDHTKPLEVRWICRSCHRKAEKRLAAYRKAKETT